MTYCFGDIRAWSRKTLLGFCWVSIFFDSLIANITWTVAQAPINHVIFWKSVMRTFRCIYVNCFNTLRFLAAVSTKLKKWTSLDNLRTITQEGNMETRQKLLIQTAHHTFLKNRHPEVTKNPHILSHKESQKMGISYGL